MVIELIALYLLVLVVLKMTMFTRVSSNAIIAMTCGLTVLMAAVAGGAMKHDLMYLGAIVTKEQFADSSPGPSTSSKSIPDKNMSHPPAPASPQSQQSQQSPHSPQSPQSALRTETVSIQHALTENVDAIEKMLRGVSNSVGGAKLVFYYSVYSPISYASNSLFWNSLVDSKVSMQFNDVPAKAAGDMVLLHGIPLGHNLITGPASSDVGLQARGQYTMFLQLRFSKTLATSYPSDIISLFGASPAAFSTNGMIFRLSDAKTTGAVSTTKINLILSNNDALVCALDGQQDIVLDDHLSYCFVIVKEPTKAKVYMSSSLKKEPVPILTADDLKMSDEFINLPMTVNNTKNLDAKLMALGGYNTALEHADVRNVCDYLFDREREAFDPDYVAALKKIKTLEESYKAMTSCPFASNRKVCDACAGIENWGTFDSIVGADQKCLQMIAEHCGNGDADTRKSGVCACWDSKNPRYASVACTNVRAAFLGQMHQNIDQLGPAALSEIKNRYSDKICPSPQDSDKGKPPQSNTPPGKPPAASGNVEEAKKNENVKADVITSHDNPVFAMPPGVRHGHHGHHGHRGHHGHHGHRGHRGRCGRGGHAGHAGHAGHNVPKPGVMDNVFSWIDDTVGAMF